MDRRAIVKGLLATALVLPFASECGAAEEKKALPAGLEEAFKKFADAVKGGKYEEVAKWITPPADKIWTNIPPLQSTIAKYEAASSEVRQERRPIPFLKGFPGTNLAEHYYESRGTIREVKEAGKDQVHVTVWTTGRVFGKTRATRFTAQVHRRQKRWAVEVPAGHANRRRARGQEGQANDPRGKGD